ncbi:MAG: hypothetical protein JWO37_1262 [Acidimicrobiales bacterium]|jgi:hypothetical protein|nr:hypothetical protein [Acidimicrobiales bacterium]
MSEAVGELRLVEQAFARPTLRLLNGKWAPVQVSVLRLAFDRDRRSIPTDRFHADVDEILAILRGVGVETPGGTGRELSRRWMASKWLVRLNADDGSGEVYELTSYALEALELVQSLSSDRPLLTESRLAAIIDVVRRQAIEATPDAHGRVERLNTQIAELEAERDRLLEGGEPEPASFDRMMEGYANLVDLISQLPSDFKRVEEAVRGHRDSLLAEFRSETRPLGLVIDEYLVRHDDLRATPEGKAFDGAFSLLRDEVMLSQLKRDLDVIASHSFTEALTADEVRAFRGTVKMVRRSLEDVLDQRSRIAKTLRDHLVNHDAVKERELSDTLARLNGVLAEWIRRTSTRARTDVGLLPEAVDTLPHVRERFYDPGDHVAPEGLDETAADAGVALTLEEILRQGGPLLARLAEQLSTAGASVNTAGARFAAFPDDLRRPVEVLGVLHLLSKIGALEAAEDRESVLTVRSDGTERLLRIPAVTITDAHVDLLAALELT